MSKTLNGTQQRYAAYDKEMLAILEALRIWRPYLASNPFTIATDHAPLQYLQSQATLSDRQARWINRLAHFQYTMIHKPGRLKPAADALSRRHPSRTVEINTALVSRPSADFLDRIQEGYKPDSFFTGVKTVLEGGRDSIEATKRKYIKQFKLTDDGLIYEMRDMEPRLCIPNDKTLRTQILYDHHDTPLAGHLGRDKTLARIKDKFYWPKMSQDVNRYVKTCDACQRFKASNQTPAGLLQPLQIPQERWTDISMDFVVQLPRTAQGYDAILVVVDRLTKRAHFCPTTTNVTAPETAQLFIRNLVCCHGMPKTIVSDRDPRFMSHFWKDLFTILGVELKPSTAFHPQTDGQTERTNRTMEQMLRMYVGYRQNDWDRYLHLVEFAYNSAEQSSIGMTPFFCDLGRHPRMPSELLVPFNVNERTQVHTTANFIGHMQEILRSARNAIIEAQARQEQNANRHRREVTLEVGDLVLLSSTHITADSDRQRPTRKLTPRFLGPFKVIQVVSSTAYKLDLPSNMNIHPVFHVSLLKNYHPNPEEFPDRQVQPPPPVIVGGQSEYEVERILDKRRRRGKVEYLVKWTVYELYDATWEPVENLKNATEAVSDYERAFAETAQNYEGE
jgi:hypothetical protein